MGQGIQERTKLVGLFLNVLTQVQNTKGVQITPTEQGKLNKWGKDLGWSFFRWKFSLSQ